MGLLLRLKVQSRRVCEFTIKPSTGGGILIFHITAITNSIKIEIFFIFKLSWKTGKIYQIP